MIPIVFVLSVTAVKDAYEDWRRYKSDEKVNHSSCRVWDRTENRYVKCEWQHIRVGDFIHLSCNEVVPADALLMKSSDQQGVCYLQTSNLDGESNLKQRQVINSLHERRFEPAKFSATVECELPNNQIYKFNGFLLHSNGERESVNKNNLLLRGCQIRNTDFVEALVLYAGSETKAMLNNSGPRYKRSRLERLMNWDILWCVLILLLMCGVGAVASGIWLGNYIEQIKRVPFLPIGTSTINPELEAFIVFWSYIIILQVRSYYHIVI